MKRTRKWLALGLLAILLVSLYLYPGPRDSFDQLYERVDAETAASLKAFREAHPVRTLEVGSARWEYLALGEGEETLLFLHGMTGAYDIWWQQMEALEDSYQVISVTYPPVKGLGAMERGVMAVLTAQGVERFHIVGTSLGGYLAQYLISRHPDVVQSLVLANTFPPNDLIAEENRAIGRALPYLPEWLVMSVLSGSIQEHVYPASEDSELVLAFGLEQTRGRMSKAQVVGRFHCVVEWFEAPDIAALGVPVLIIEADNDPLVEAALRDLLKDTYPTAEVHTFEGGGHFPYLNQPDIYHRLLLEFLNSSK